MTLSDEEKYQLIAENISDVIWVINLTSLKFTYISPSVYNLRGFTVEEAMNQSLSESLTPDSAARVYQVISERVKEFKVSGKVGTLVNEFQQPCKDGSIIWIEAITKMRVAIDGSLEVIGVSRDITKRKQAEFELKESEEKYRLLFEKSDDAILIIDDNKFIDCNAAVVKMLGYGNKDELLNVHPSVLSPEKQPDGRLSFEKAEEMMGLCFQNGFHRFEWIHKRASGEPFPAEVWLTAIPYKGKKIIHTIWRDLTERKKVEKELYDVNERLKEINSTKDKFFSIIGHDLKNPFSGILGLSGLLIDNIANYDIPTIQKYIRIIYSTTSNAYALLENLLEWSRSQTGSINFQPEVINLKKKIEHNVTLIETLAQKKNIQISAEAGDACIVFGDRNMVNTVFRNLLTNAVKFTRVGGSIKISVKEVDSSYEIAFSDTGVGMSPEMMSNLFKIDTRFRTIGTDNETGTGLGLLLCREFIERHGGKISVKSEVGKGTEFTVSLPKM